MPVKQLRVLFAAPLLLILLLSACVKSIPQSSATDDATVTARVKTALLNDPAVGALRIDVATSSGVVTLSGAVKSPGEQQRAIQVARGVNGVKDVRSSLVVSP